MKNRTIKAEKFAGGSVFLFCLTFFACCLPTAIFAQPEISPTATESFSQPPPPADVAPPPLNILSASERKTLDSENNLKKRTQLSLALMEAKLIRAEQLTLQDNFKQSLDDLGGFQALLENTFTYLEKNDTKNRADNRFKQLEIFLRKQVPRLENLRRSMPYKFGYYVLGLMKVVRETRAKAVEPLFSESVVTASKP